MRYSVYPLLKIKVQDFELKYKFHILLQWKLNL